MLKTVYFIWQVGSRRFYWIYSHRRVLPHHANLWFASLPSTVASVCDCVCHIDLALDKLSIAKGKLALYALLSHMSTSGDASSSCMPSRNFDFIKVLRCDLAFIALIGWLLSDRSLHPSLEFNFSLWFDYYIELMRISYIIIRNDALHLEELAPKLQSYCSSLKP